MLDEAVAPNGNLVASVYRTPASSVMSAYSTKKAALPKKAAMNTSGMGSLSLRAPHAGFDSRCAGSFTKTICGAMYALVAHCRCAGSMSRTS